MITAILGKNQFAARRELQQQREAFRKQYGQGSVQEIRGEDTNFAELISLVSSQGLFNDETLVILMDMSANKQLMEQLHERLTDVPESASLIIFEPGLDKRTALYKKLKKEATCLEFNELDERDLAKWAVEEFAQAGGQLSLANASYLVQKLGNDQWAVFNELQKLRNVADVIDRTHIDEHVDESFQETIFNLLDQAFSKQADRAHKTYRAMVANKVEPHYILSMIAWQLQNLAICVFNKETPTDTIARTYGISPFVIQKTMTVAKKTSKKELKDIITQATYVDIDAKTKAAYDVDAAVDMLIARIAAT